MTNTATTPSGQPLGISHKPSATEAMFDRLKAENKPAFIGYLPYGFPNPDISLDALRTMIEHGVDAVEIGLPITALNFSMLQPVLRLPLSHLLLLAQRQLSLLLPALSL